MSWWLEEVSCDLRELRLLRIESFSQQAGRLGGAEGRRYCISNRVALFMHSNCMCICVCVRERERHRERLRQRDTETQRERKNTNKQEQTQTNKTV